MQSDMETEDMVVMTWPPWAEKLMEKGNPESHGQPPADGNVKQMDFPLNPIKDTVQSCLAPMS